MDALKAVLAAKRKAQEEAFQGKKFLKRSELEQVQLKKLKEEEERERQEKEARRKQQDGGVARDTDAARPSSRAAGSRSRPESRAGDGGQAEEPAKQRPTLTKEQVVRRLRRLGEPATLFGETDEERQQRLHLAEQNLQVDDETAGGQQANIHLALEKEKQKQKKPPIGKGKQQEGKGKEGGGELEAVDPQQQARHGVLYPLRTVVAALMAQFKRAAEQLAEQHMVLEDRLAKWLRQWCEEWERDLEARPDEVKQSLEGRQATVRFKESQVYFKPLFERLRQRSLDPEMVAGLKLMFDAMRDRNYLHAYKIYMGIAVGNSAWPIGVTQVGLHERAAREKISFKGTQGQAHIMNDEATRKFISAMKRLMTFLQRRFPTDPSRSVDFDGGRSLGRGAAGGGSDKLALLEAMAKGEDTVPAPAIGWVEPTGEVKVPLKWEHLLKGAMQEVLQSEEREEQQQAAAKTQPRAATPAVSQ
ncbi:hypothetical protein N2152v2_008305 [Parachlorella kessleri]